MTRRTFQTQFLLWDRDCVIQCGIVHDDKGNHLRHDGMMDGVLRADWWTGPDCCLEENDVWYWQVL